MPEISYLFRFRDLVARTLEEHRRIIEEQGQCWWGWWKRPSEDHRREVWLRLKATASTADPVPVGLFHSGTGEVFKAWVTAIVEPLDAAHPGHSHPPVPKGEEDLIPSYYRKSPFSYAWIKFSNIEQMPMPFFGNYSFATLPRLPNYATSVLSRLVGKVILDPDELRGMDTTIWEVRRAQEHDLREKIILTVPALPGPISVQPVNAPSSRILHITDLHFAVGHNRTQHVWRLDSENSTTFSLAEAIDKAVGNRQIGLVIVTGDLTFTALKEEYDEAATALLRLLGALDLSSDNLVLLPGNHDIAWSKREAYDPNAPIENAPAEAKANYKEFYRKMFRHEPNDYLAMGRRYMLPNGAGIEVCALNSSSLETGKDFLAGLGRIEESAFETVSQELGWSDSATLALRLLAVHHHLALTEDIEPYGGYYRGFGIAVDAPRIQRMAAKKGVQLALHGHKHRSFIWRSNVYELPEHTQMGHRLGQLSIIGGGSAGSRETEGEQNFFNLIEVSPDQVDLAIFRSRHKGIFEAMQRWEARFRIEKEARRLLLDEWNERKQQ